MPAFDMTVSTDASPTRWEQHGQTQRLGVGGYHAAEAIHHIFLLEFKAVRIYTPTPRHILLQMKNLTAVAYVKKRGGTRSYSLSAEAPELCALALHSGCWITARRIPGITNTTADLASHRFNSYLKCTLYQDVFHQICYTSQPPSSSVCIQINILR